MSPSSDDTPATPESQPPGSRIVIREEQPADVSGIAKVNRLAFERNGEAILVDRLRGDAHWLHSFVAVEQGQVVGHILFTRVAIDSAGAPPPVAAIGPMAVLPSHQRNGIGSRLIRAGLDACGRSGHVAVFVLGWPDYYGRFGFRPASSFYGISCEFDVPSEAFMALELSRGALAGVGGVVRYAPAFQDV